jgi:carbon-monoxide dehydrogenase medium subunit
LRAWFGRPKRRFWQPPGLHRASARRNRRQAVAAGRQTNAAGVAAAAKILPDGTVLEARVALGAVSSHPFLTKAGEFLAGKRLTDEVVAEAGRMVASRAKPMDNADFDVHWRKEVVAEFVTYALREIRGDDTNAVRLRIARRTL